MVALGEDFFHLTTLQRKSLHIFLVFTCKNVQILFSCFDEKKKYLYTDNHYKINFKTYRFFFNNFGQVEDDIFEVPLVICIVKERVRN